MAIREFLHTSTDPHLEYIVENYTGDRDYLPPVPSIGEWKWAVYGRGPSAFCAMQLAIAAMRDECDINIIVNLDAYSTSTMLNEFYGVYHYAVICAGYNAPMPEGEYIID